MIINELKEEIAGQINSCIKKIYKNKNIKELTASDITDAPGSFGDFSFPCFSLSPQLKKSPKSIAEELSEKTEKTKQIVSTASINGYLNFTVDKKNIFLKLIEEINSKKITKFDKKNKRVMIEYSSPNTNKPLHIGHLRNDIIGMSISNLLSEAGYEVIKANLYNDRGIGVSEVIYDYLKYHKDEEPNIKPDHYIGMLYSEFNAELKDNELLMDDVTEILKRWENNDPEIISVWEKIRSWVLEGYKETYKLFGTKFDVEYFESDLYRKAKEIVDKAYKKGILKKTENNALIAPLDEFGLPDKIIVKSNGTALYVTTDIYLAKKKFEDFKLDKSIYVVASEQDLYFKQLFKILEKMKLADPEKLYHLSYGLVSLPTGRIKSREGTTADIDALYEETYNFAKEQIIERNSEIKEDRLSERASKIALAAMKFFIAKVDPSKNMKYNPKESLSFEGETGPYLLYTYARIKSIFRRLDISCNQETIKEIKNNIKKSHIILDEIQQRIIMQAIILPEAVNNSAESYKPNIMSRYLIDLSQLYNSYYHSTSIINETDTTIKNTGILISYVVSSILKKGLALLDIETLEEM